MQAGSLVMVSTALLHGYASGPDPMLSGAPGEQTCTSCHRGGGAPQGNVQIKVAGDGTTYTPGTKMSITVSFAGGTARGYGFEMSARVATNNSQAGDFITPTPSGMQVLCANGANKASGKTSCTNNTVQYIEHSRVSTTGTWTFDWTPPATDVGTVKLYVAGNAANLDSDASGALITTASVSLTAGAGVVPPVVTKPVISSGGVVSSFNQRQGIVDSGWLEIHGATLITGTARDWAAADFANGTPTALDGTSVKINGVAAFVRHIGPTEIDVQAPTDTATGPVQVVVTSGGNASNPISVTKSGILPAVLAPFTANGNTYVLAALGDGALAGPAGAVANVNLRPVAAGETVTFFGVGFGTVATIGDGSPIKAGTITQKPSKVTNPVSIQIGGIAVPAANIVYQGLALDAIGLYQFTLVIPSSVASGDQAITFSAGGVDSGQTMMITIQ